MGVTLHYRRNEMEVTCGKSSSSVNNTMHNGAVGVIQRGAKLQLNVREIGHDWCKKDTASCGSGGEDNDVRDEDHWLLALRST